MTVRQRMETFEEMGNDGAVATAIEARCQDVYAANWDLASEDKTPLGATILDFAKREIDAVIEDLLRWLAEGALQYGFTALEKVFAWKDLPDGSRRIGLAKLAHLRQVTCEIHITETGDLEYVKQRVFDGQKFVEPEIPLAKLIFRCLKREGADYYGKPPLRKFYREWKFKTQLEKINLGHFDRFGLGVVKWTEPPGGLIAADRDRLQQFGAALRSALENVVSVPSGTGMDIVTASGQLAASELAWVQEYNSRIQKIILTQGVDLGTTQTGSRAVGETFADQLQGAVQADAENIASIILEQLIKPLVIYNFGEQEQYPEFSPSARAKATTALFTNLAQAKTAGVIHPRPEDEIFVRDVMGLPAVDLATLKREAADRLAQVAQQAAAVTAAAGTSTSPASSTAPDGPSPSDRTPSNRPPALRRLAAYDLAPGAPAPAIKGQTSHRTVEFSEWEQRILQPDLLARQLDLESQRTTAETHDVLRQIDEYLATQAEKAAAGGAAALAAFNPKVSPRLRQALIDALQAAADRVKELGANAVRREIQLQLGPEGVGPQRPPSGGMIGAFTRALRAILLDQAEDARSIQLAAEVKRAAEEEIDRREQSTRGAISIALSQAAGSAIAVLASVLSTALRSALELLSTGRTEDNVQRVVNTSFGIGRSEAAQAINDAAANGGGGRAGRSGLVDANGDPIELVAKVYSAVMDFGTCDECAKWDGARFPIDYPEDITGVQAPNPRCAGGARCRCQFIYVTDQEVPANVGATKGPNA
jgi:hypothetical protein